jgi:hypothetical protein
MHMHPKASFDARGVCRRPSMIFCDSQKFADFLVELLKVSDASLKLPGSVDLSIDRICGIWV